MTDIRARQCVTGNKKANHELHIIQLMIEPRYCSENSVGTSFSLYESVTYICTSVVVRNIILRRQIPVNCN